MNNEVKNKILGLLNYKAPNWVSELIFNAHDIPDDENFQRTIEKLEGDGLIEKQIDLRTKIEKPMNYYRIKSTKNLAIRDYMKIGDTKIPSCPMLIERTHVITQNDRAKYKLFFQKHLRYSLQSNASSSKNRSRQ